MLTEEHLQTDVLVIGSGIAGTMAAIEARRAGADVTIVSKGRLGKEASTAYALGLCRPGDGGGARIPGYDNQPGKYLENPAVVEAVNREALSSIEAMMKLGVPMVTESDSAGGMAYRPLGSDQTHGGSIALDILRPALGEMGVRVVEDCLVPDLLKEEGRVVGACGLHGNSRWLNLHARATVLATGGAAGIYEHATTSRRVLGDGYALALKAGACLANLEFADFYPVGLSTPEGQYVHCAPATLTMRAARLTNKSGEDIVQKHFGITLQEGAAAWNLRFEWLARAVAIEAGDGPVWLDLTGVPPAEWDRLPERNWKQIRRTGVDMRERAVAVLHMGHSFRGGIPIDPVCHTSLPGLYACGEVTAGYYAAEKAWTPFASCLATGAIAGRSASGDLKPTALRPQASVKENPPDMRAMVRRTGKISSSQIQRETRRLCYRHVGPVRSESLLKEGIEKLSGLEEAARQTPCNSMDDLKELIEMGEMLLVGRAVMEAALCRRESRGTHYRKDFPARDDANWLRHVVVSRDRTTGQVKAERGDSLTNGLSSGVDRSPRPKR